MKRTITALLVSGVLLSLGAGGTGCENLPGTARSQGAVIGGVAGAAAGAAIAKNNRLLGALIGAAIGAGGGYLIGVAVEHADGDDDDKKKAREAAERAEQHQLAAAVPSPGASQQVPAAFVMDGQIVKGVPGVLTVLHDGLYDDREIIEWLFRDDPSLPGRPIDALRENRGSEVKRRAQAMAL